MDLEGVYTPIVTAFDDRDELDLDATAAVIEFVLAGGMRGLVPCGTTGEYYACSMDERLRILEHTRDVTAGRAQLIAGCNAGSTRDAIAYGEAARDLGYDAIMLAAPYTSLPTQRELAAHYATVAQAVGLPVVLYNYPARAGVEIGIECLDQVVDLPEIVAIKESSGDFSRFLHLRRRYADRHHDHVRLRRPGRRLLLVGRPLLAGRHVERAAAPPRRDHGRRQRGRPRHRLPAVRRHPAVGAEHGVGLLQPEGQARPAAPGDRRPASSASRCCRSRTTTAAELLAALDQALAVSLAPA